MIIRLPSNKVITSAIIKRDEMPLKKKLLIRVLTFVITFLISIFLFFLIIKKDYFQILGTVFTGAFARPWKLLMETFILLAFGIAVLPAFKMKYWNMGANGQVLIGALVSMVVMISLNDFGYNGGVNNGFTNFLVIVITLISGIAASIVWAVIPAIFKVLFRTNEVLFTLMMNYIAVGLVSYVNYILTKGTQENFGIINSATETGWMPVIINSYFIPIMIFLVMTIMIHFYMSKTKHGYEISVVGDSINTAKYVGMNTKKIVIRTLVLSGLLTGIIGFLYASAIDQTITSETCGALGFTAVLIAWFSNFNPLTMGFISFLLAFLTLGTNKIASIYSLGSNDLASVVIGLIFFSILISEFFIRFKIVFRKTKKDGVAE